MTPRLLALSLIAAIACCATSASAQTMYRCGSSFQDHPCGGGQAGTVIGSAPARAQAAASAPSAQCAQRGLASQKISWYREAGKTQQEQADVAAGGSQRDLIGEVYSHRGTSVEVRAAIESDCMAAEDRAAQAAALFDAANRLKAGGGSATARGEAIDGTPSTVAAATPAARDNGNANAASAKQATCLRLNNELANDQAKQRMPSAAPAMEQLRQQVRDVDDRIRAAGC